MPESSQDALGIPLDALAQRLREAADTRTPLAPLTESLPTLTPQVAYDLQQALVNHQVAAGAKVIGYKLGFTSRAKQAAIGIYEPIYGTLLESMRLPPNQPLPLDRFISPRVEPEIAFVLRDALEGPEVTATDVLRATESLHPALDVLDSRYEGFRFQLPDVIADNASGAAFHLGPAVTSFEGLDLASVRGEFLRNGQRVSEGSGQDVMGHPAEAVAWLVRKLHARGLGLTPGMVVLSGAFVAPLLAEAGDVFEAAIQPLGRVALPIAKEAP
jgi:2-keto-4-pentenoate hydratase